MNITGNTIVITGGTSGIGLAFAEAFIKNGNKVIITGRREDRLKAIQKRLPEIIVKVSDIMDTAQRTALAEWIQQQHPDTNVLINNAGIQLTADLTKPCSLDRIEAEVATNFIAPVHLTTLLVQHLQGKENAAIINISSGLAFAPLAFMPIYCATKAAIHSFTLSLRHQLKKSTVKVFEIIPPSVDTELGHDRRPDKSQTHGGMPVTAFIEQALVALKNDTFEAAIAEAVGLHAKRESLFEQMNSRF